jgi:hypothetical protein
MLYLIVNFFFLGILLLLRFIGRCVNCLVSRVRLGTRVLLLPVFAFSGTHFDTKWPQSLQITRQYGLRQTRPD